MDHRYEIFAAAVLSKSFTRAAKELGYTQSAVSQAVRSLEAELGTVLITRSHDGITLTRDGEIFFPYFESILAGERALHVRMKEMHGLTGSLIRIGTFSSISQNLLPPLISSFLVSYPETRFELRFPRRWPSFPPSRCRSSPLSPVFCSTRAATVSH